VPGPAAYDMNFIQPTSDVEMKEEAAVNEPI